MKSLLSIVVILSLGFDLHSQCHKINFVNTSLIYAYDKAQIENKSIFIFLYEVGDARADFFQSAIFYKTEVCTPFNQKFINIKARTNSNVGIEVINQYQITEFPCFILLDQNRLLVEKTSAIADANDLLRFAEKAR